MKCRDFYGRIIVSRRLVGNKNQNFAPRSTHHLQRFWRLKPWGFRYEVLQFKSSTTWAINQILTSPFLQWCISGIFLHFSLVLSRETGRDGKGTGIPCGRGAGKGRESIPNSPIPDIFLIDFKSSGSSIRWWWFQSNQNQKYLAASIINSENTCHKGICGGASELIQRIIPWSIIFCLMKTIFGAFFFKQNYVMLLNDPIFWLKFVR